MMCTDQSLDSWGPLFTARSIMIDRWDDARHDVDPEPCELSGSDRIQVLTHCYGAPSTCDVASAGTEGGRRGRKLRILVDE